LPQEPPNLLSEDDAPPALPQRPINEAPIKRQVTPPPPPPVKAQDPENISDFWSTQDLQNTREIQLQQQRQYEEEQRRLQEQREAELRQQQLLAMQQQREFEAQQAAQAEQQRLAQEQLQRDQYNRQVQGTLAEMERELLAMRGQYERDQLMLQQYDKVGGY